MPNYFQISPVVFDNNYILMFTTDQIYFSTIGEVGSPLKVYLLDFELKKVLLPPPREFCRHILS